METTVMKGCALALMHGVLMLFGQHAHAAEPVQTQSSQQGEVLPLPVPSYQGVMGKNIPQSKPYFPPLTRPPKGAPNIILVMLDDVGFGHSSTFGGPVPTPTIEGIARQGLRYNNFHTTGMCAPTRAALLTGRNQHRVGAGVVSEAAYGYPGYDGLWGKDAATIAEILKQHGYSTSMFGKWHNTPEWESTVAGPFDRWPTGMGFEYFYGFLGGDTNQFDPALYENTIPVDKPYQDDYHLNTDMANRAIRWMRNLHSAAPDKPFFLYFAPGATHAPLQAPREWIDRFKGRFDHGWDRERELTFARQKKLGVIPKDAKLTPRPPELPAWNSFKPEEQRVMARMQEVFAGFLAQTDHEIGRVVGALGDIGAAENTLVIYIVGDNGGSAEGSPIGTFNELITTGGGVADIKMEDNIARIDELGGPLAYGHYPAAWAWAGSTPFPYFKRVPSHMGAMRTAMVMQWPSAIKDRGGLRSQFHHVNDIVPTLLDAVGVPAPKVVHGVEQMSMDGVSMAYTYDQPKAPPLHKTQYFEIMGKYGIYDDGWFASSKHGEMPWEIGSKVSQTFDDDVWELYDLRSDFSQAVDLAEKHPDKLKAMQALFDQEARRNNIYPLVAGGDWASLALRPHHLKGRNSVTFYPGMVRLREGSAPNTLNKSFSITAELGAHAGRQDGVLLTQGGRFGGYAFYVQNGKLVFTYNRFGLERTRIEAREPLPTTATTVRYEFVKDSGTGLGLGGIGRLYIGDRLVGEGRIARTAYWRYSLDETLDVGEDHGTPVEESYQVPFRFGGDLRKVTVDLKP